MSVSIHRMKMRCVRSIWKLSIVNHRSVSQDMRQESWVEQDLLYFSGVTSGMRSLHFIVSVMIVAVGDWLAKRESNLLVYNGILAFISESDYYRSFEDGNCRASGPYYDRYRHASDQWTEYNERNQGSSSERLHFRIH